MDERARNELVTEHLPLVRIIARSFRKSVPANVELDDLISAGSLGLIDAASKFDSSRDLKFKTYAEFRIRGAILDFLRQMDWMPRSIRDKRKLLETTRAELARALEREPTAQDMAEALGIGIDELFETEDLVATRSLIYESEDLSPSDEAALERHAQDEPAEAFEIDLSQYLEGRDLQVVEMYLGGHTMKLIGRRLGMNESRACQIVQACSNWMRERLSLASPMIRRCKMPRKQDGLVDTVEAAEICGATVASISNWVANGFLDPALTDGRSRFFKRADLDGIRVLRTKYGKAWTRHTDSATAHDEPEAVETVVALEIEDADAVDTHRPDAEALAHDAKSLFMNRMIERARQAHAAGKEDVAYWILWTVVGDWFEVEAPEFAKTAA